jgi:hypothetical protein
MEQTYSYRGFDVVVNAQREDDASGNASDETQRCVYVTGVTLKTDLIAGEWSTGFRVEPLAGRSSADLREVLSAGFAAATKVVDDVIGVMGWMLAARHNESVAQVQ